MRFACDRTTLVEKLSILARGVSTRSALPVLSGILLQARDGRLDLYSTDMELSIKASIATNVETDGEAVVPARLFTDVVRNMAAGEVARRGRRRGRQDPRRQGLVQPELVGRKRLPADLVVRHERAFTVGHDAVRRDAREGGPRGLARRDPADPHRRARHDRRRQAQDGRHRQLPPERQGDAARRRPGRRDPGHRAGQGADRGAAPRRRHRRRRPAPRDHRKPGAVLRSATCGSPRA